MFVREHSDTGANNDKPIIGHLPQEFFVACILSIFFLIRMSMVPLYSQIAVISVMRFNI